MTEYISLIALFAVFFLYAGICETAHKFDEWTAAHHHASFLQKMKMFEYELALRIRRFL